MRPTLVGKLSVPLSRFDAGMRMGAVAYMSPERLMGENEIQFSDDIYSFGCTMSHLLFGEPPHYGPSAAHIIRNRLAENRLPHCISNSTLPTALLRILRHMLSAKGEDRPTAADVNDAFQRLRR